nr:oligosaccharide flippase family protein [uncultured Desulfuromonas sp.]
MDQGAHPVNSVKKGFLTYMSARVHLRNLAFNWGGHAATLLVMFFLSPYIVGKLDAVSYGIWSLLNVLTGYMGIFDLGVRASVGRHVALYLGKDDPVGVDETIRSGFGFFSLVGVLILLVGILLGWLFPILFDGVSSKDYDTVRVLLPLMVVNVWLSAIAAIYSSVLAAHDRFDIARGVDVIVLIVRTIGTIYVLKNSWGLWGLVITVIVGNVCAVAGNWFFARRVHNGLKSFPFCYKKIRLKELFSYGIAVFIINSAVKMIGQSDLVVVGIFLSVADVREYSVGAMLVLYTSTFLKIIVRTYFPAIQRAIARQKREEVIELFSRQMNISIFFGVIVYLGYAFFSEPFIYLWMGQPSFGRQSVEASSQIMGILAFASLPMIYINPIGGILAAMGRIRSAAWVSLGEALTNLFFSIVAVTFFDLGLLGVAYATLLARFVVSGVAMPCLFCQVMSIKLVEIFKNWFLPGLLAMLCFAGLCYLSHYFYTPQTWLSFLLNVLIVAIVGALFLVKIIFTQESLFLKWRKRGG